MFGCRPLKAGCKDTHFFVNAQGFTGLCEKSVQHDACESGYGHGVGAGKLAYACQCGRVRQLTFSWFGRRGGGWLSDAWSRDFAHRQCVVEWVWAALFPQWKQGFAIITPPDVGLLRGCGGVVLIFLINIVSVARFC